MHPTVYLYKQLYLFYLICAQWFLAPDSELPACTAVEKCDKQCSIHSSEFTISKHRADLFYYQKQYGKAVELYKKILALIPSSNVCVSREIRDALARCYLRLGEGELAKKEAERLVRPCS